MTLPIRQGRGGGMEEPAPRRKHPERQVGESYPDALARVAGERDAALRDVAVVGARVAALLKRCEDIDATTWFANDDPAGTGHIDTREVWALLAPARASRDLGLYDQTDGQQP